jgi:uncharacterized membrane protein
MSKKEFLDCLRQKLVGLPKKEVEERLSFYSEMIDDRIEEGLSEKEAVSDIGQVGDIVSQIVEDIPLTKIAKERIKPKRRLKAWEIILLALGSPIWLSLGISVLAVVFSLYVSLWAVVVSIWAVFVSVAVAAPCSVLVGIVYAIMGGALMGVIMIGGGIFCSGLAIFVYAGCKAATYGTLQLGKRIALGIKRSFIRKEKL